MTEETTNPELTVYLRSSTPLPARDRQREVVVRAEQLEQEGRIESVRVRQWEDRIVVENGDEETVQTFETFKSRAAESGHSIEPFFQEHERAGTREIVVPIICLAVHVGEDLKRVFPCRDENAAYSVWDCLTALETDGKLADLAD
jgi:hypothetical protein